MYRKTEKTNQKIHITQRMSLAQVNLMHVVVIGPLLYAIGHYEDKTPNFLYTALGLLAITIPFVVRIPKAELTYRSIINAVHYVFWIALFGYVAYMGNTTPNYLYMILKLLGITVIAIHLYLFSQKMFVYYA